MLPRGGLVSIRNYIALKLILDDTVLIPSLVSIRNYIALKPVYQILRIHLWFSIHTKLHRSKTSN